jgi:hypothetical protein
MYDGGSFGPVLADVWLVSVQSRMYCMYYVQKGTRAHDGAVMERQQGADPKSNGDLLCLVLQVLHDSMFLYTNAHPLYQGSGSATERQAAPRAFATSWELVLLSHSAWQSCMRFLQRQVRPLDDVQVHKQAN